MKDSGKVKFIGITGYPLINFRLVSLPSCMLILDLLLSLMGHCYNVVLKSGNVEFESGTFLLSQDSMTYLLYMPNQGDTKLTLTEHWFTGCEYVVHSKGIPIVIHTDQACNFESCVSKKILEIKRGHEEM